MNRHHEAAPLLDGWGNSGPFYDHRYLGYDRAPKGSLYVTARPMGPYLKNLHPLPHDLGINIPDDTSDDDDDDQYEDDGVDVYGHVDLAKTLGQQLAVWCHRTPETVAIFTPVPGDTLSTAVTFARTSLQCDPATDKVLVLQPGHQRPVDPASLYHVMPGSSLLVVPKFDYVVLVEVTQMSLKFEMVVNLTMTVRSLKARLHREKGFAVDCTDLLYRDEPMENQRHLFDYHVTQGATVFALLHLVYDTKVKVETFWGLNYELYVDPSMTSASLLHTVLQRTISTNGGDAASFYHLALPRHALVLYTAGGEAMKWGGCLGLYGVQDGTVFSLSTIALAHDMSLQRVAVMMEGKVHNFRMSKLDYWSVLALKLHGMTGFPVNLMRMYCGHRELDLARAAGPFTHKCPAILLDMSLVTVDEDFVNGVDFDFKLGNDMVEALTIAPARSVKAVKTILEKMGVPNATAYDLFVDGYRLPNHERIGDVVEEHRRPVELKLRQYPVFIHAPKGVIYKMTAHAQEALGVFKARVEMKTGLAQRDHYFLMAGMPIPDKDATPVFRSPLVINCSVFLMAVKPQHKFLVVWDDWLVKLRLPFQPAPSEIKQLLWKDRNIPEGSLASLGGFLQWFFALKASSNGMMTDVLSRHQVAKQRQSRPKKRRDSLDAELQKSNTKQIKQLQHELDKRHRRKHHKNHHHKQHNTYEQHQHQPHHDPNQADDEEGGLFVSTQKHGGWRRVNPEDLVKQYLRSTSQPPDPATDLRDLHERGGNNYAPRKHHSAGAAVPDLARRRGLGQLRRHEPTWMHSLQRIQREDRLEPAYADVTRRRKHKKRVRGVRR